MEVVRSTSVERAQAVAREMLATADRDALASMTEEIRRQFQ